jgi:hypothetical protein
MQLKIKDVNYDVPALSLNSLRNGGLDLIKQGDELLKDETKSWLDIINSRGKVVLLALRQVNPQLTEEDVFDVLHMANIGTVYNTVIGLSGLGEEKPA